MNKQSAVPHLAKPAGLDVFLYFDLWPLKATNQEVNSVKGDYWLWPLWMIVYIIPYWSFDPCWPISGPVYCEPQPASICISSNYLWWLLLSIRVVKMKPCSGLIEKGRSAAMTPHHAFPFPPTRHVKHIKLNVPANLTQLFVCCWSVCTRVFMVALNAAHVLLYVQLSEHTRPCWRLHVMGQQLRRKRQKFVFFGSGSKGHQLQHRANTP